MSVGILYQYQKVMEHLTQPVTVNGRDITANITNQKAELLP